ncbi:Protein THYLAKOID FORMATION 1, chloroplastic [Cymbomonas tetramitiformis]|uniref:Protein THYLAKOID FORMATION 1, chloroplastic n=1 Tax=Cymbomonas tetramitiformis TaxID=36881 RepID=A0AAE0FVM9_9CHLO|nr:Protein THYLAKOID FORMATION 1, chloroplastic [Cymbomonas tetramitiformis]|eukprot:gene3015-3835_t
MQNTIAKSTVTPLSATSCKHHTSVANGQKICQPPKAILSSRATFCSRSVIRSLQTRRTASPKYSQKALQVSAEFSPPTLSDTKDAFIKSYPYPIPAVFNTILQELLCMQHFARFQANYKYSPVIALGFISVFDQVFAEYKYGNAEEIFSSYIKALEESPETYRSDAVALTEAAKGAGSADALNELAAVKDLAAQDKLVHNKFLSIGLFRCLELAGVTEPAALESLVKASGLSLDAVNRDLLTYKGLLSKLNAAKEMEKQFLEREQKVTAQRAADLAAKEAKAEKAEEVVNAE